jgi:lycopene cyclase domain-containing protein
MTYFNFLAIFIGVPIGILWLVNNWDNRSKRPITPSLSALQGWTVIRILIVVAVIYTTPWDNYLVATGVWWYNPELVTGFTIGWVPIEEYTFFVVQTIMTGLLVMVLARRVPPVQTMNAPESRSIRLTATVIVGLIWIACTSMLILSFISPNEWKQWTYFGLETSWGLFPILIQMIVGADILWSHRRIVIPAILIPSIYLSLADTVALGEGTWVIDPQQSLPVLLGGILPIEEAIFFTITNTLVVMGMTLALAWESQKRIPSKWADQLRQRKLPSQFVQEQ